MVLLEATFRQLLSERKPWGPEKEKGTPESLDGPPSCLVLTAYWGGNPKMGPGHLPSKRVVNAQGRAARTAGGESWGGGVRWEVEAKLQGLGGLWSLEGAPSRHEGGPEPCGQVLGSGQHSAHLDSGRSWHWGLGMAQPTPTAPSGWHFDTKVFAKLFQKHKREHGVGHEADASRQEALVKG